MTIDEGLPVTAQATLCATLVDEWVRAGLTDAVIAPGSRSTPLALALVAEPRLAVQVFHDERAASFAALGCGLATGRPAVLLCTSGTAAAHFHGAVIEAHQAGVPMLVCTADRPPELQHVGAPQTIDQTGLYGSAVRWAVEVGVADPAPASAASWRSLAARAVAEAVGARGRPGPVHLNLAFRDPLVGAPGDLPPGRAGGAPWHTLVVAGGEGFTPPPELVDSVAARCAGRRGVVIAGGGGAGGVVVQRAAAALGWPVLADPRAAVPRSVAHWDALLRVEEFTGAHRPDVVLQVGSPPASKVLAQWLAASGAEVITVVRPGEWFDPDRQLHMVVVADPDGLLGALAARPATPAPDGIEGAWDLTNWDSDWYEAGLAADRALEVALGRRDQVTEPAVARAAVAAVPPGGRLVVASSMPVRDVEWFAGPPAEGAAVYANRGANGIDGTVSTAIGVAAASGRPTVVLLGDVAFLHDSTALIGLDRRALPLVIVVVDNDGGGIFSFLPQADSLPTERFEQLFGTPHGVRPEMLAAAHGIPSLTVEDPTLLESSITGALASGQPWLVVARTDRTQNVAVHRALNGAIAKAVRQLG